MIHGFVATRYPVVHPAHRMVGLAEARRMPRHEFFDFFHPERERGAARERRVRVAKFICGHCPVIDSCRAHALTAVEPYGIWGGLSESELRVATDRPY